MSRPNTPQGFWDKVDKSGPGECWLWMQKPDAQGYAIFRLNGLRMKAHRFAYEALIGPIPEGLTLDHLCRVRHCVNPDHLEPVTLAENTRRSWDHPSLRNGCAPKAHCPQGHRLSPENTYVNPTRGSRECRVCRRSHRLKSKCKNPEPREPAFDRSAHGVPDRKAS